MRPSSSVLFTVLSLVVALHGVSAEDTSCTADDGDRYFDLNPLKSTTDYEVKPPSGAQLVLNVCRTLVRDLWNPEPPTPDAPAAFVRGPRGDIVLGALNTTLAVIDGSPVLTFNGGSMCPRAPELRVSATVRFLCPAYAHSYGHSADTPTVIAQWPTDIEEDEVACSYVLEWRTTHACPTVRKFSVGYRVGIIVSSIIIGVFFFYVVIGVLYRRYVLHLRGVAQLPRFSVLHIADALRFARDAADDVWSRRADPFDRYGAAWPGWRGSGGGGGAGYETLASTREEGEAILGDDDDEDEDEDDSPVRGPGNVWGERAARQGESLL